MSQPKVYIVILNYRQWEDARECLASVLRSDYTNYSVWLIDNNSGNRSIENLAAWVESGGIEEFPGQVPVDAGSTGYVILNTAEVKKLSSTEGLPRIVLVNNETNDGFAGGNNLALNLLRKEDAYVWLLNPDMIVEEGTLPELVKFARLQKPGSIIGAEIRSWEKPSVLLFYGGGRINFNFATVRMIGREQDISRIDYISGASLFTKAQNFQHYDLLPVEYFLYWEETDWCYRARQQGADLLVCRSAVCYDKISTVIGNSYLAHYYYARNGLLFISKYRKSKTLMVLFFMALRFLKRLGTGQWGRARGLWKGTVDFFKRKYYEAE